MHITIETRASLHDIGLTMHLDYEKKLQTFISYIMLVLSWSTSIFISRLFTIGILLVGGGGGGMSKTGRVAVSILGVYTHFTRLIQHCQSAWTLNSMIIVYGRLSCFDIIMPGSNISRFGIELLSLKRKLQF